MFPSRKPPNVIAERFASIFAAHNIEPNQIPRLLPSLRYKDLDSAKSLLQAMTPEMLDATSHIFGLRIEWLEGLDEFPYVTHWARGEPKTVLSELSNAVSARGTGRNHFPLRVLTTSMKLERTARHQQWLLPVIVETVDELGDTPVHRCRIFGNVYDWTVDAARLELKAIMWLVWRQLRAPVPLFQVTPDELENVAIGRAVPSVLWRKGLISEPSLEDFVLPPLESHQAKESDELPMLQAYLETSGLKDWVLPVSSATSLTASKAEAPPAISSEPSPSKHPGAPRKRERLLEDWAAIIAAAQTMWAREPQSSIAAVVAQLKTMAHLKARGLSDSAIHKKIAPWAPPGVRAKPGRKPKKSA